MHLSSKYSQYEYFVSACIYVYLYIHSTTVMYPDNLVWSLRKNSSNHEYKRKAMLNNECILNSMYNDYLASSFIHNGGVILGEGRCTESRVGTDPLIKFPLQDTPVESV